MKRLRAPVWILWTYYILDAASCEMILRVDPLALLSATLRTYQKVVCDTDQVAIACPRGTSISIEFAQYKFTSKDRIAIEDMCTPKSSDDEIQTRTKAKHLLRGSGLGRFSTRKPTNQYDSSGFDSAFASTVAEPVGFAEDPNQSFENKKAPQIFPTNAEVQPEIDKTLRENCMWPNALQYSLLQTVVEACQKKNHCKFSASTHYGAASNGASVSSGTSSYQSTAAISSAVNMQPCPKRKKIIQIAYKCRPYEFRSKVACNNEVAPLECNPYSRIAVYSASFGRTEYESIQCPQTQGVREETCLASYATETVMQICHGRRRCNLAADAKTFGTPCQPNSRMYLKVVYTCVPKQVLKDQYETEADETEDLEREFNNIYDDELSYKESEAIPNFLGNTTRPITTADFIPGNYSGSDHKNMSVLPETEKTFVNPVMTHSADYRQNDDREQLYIYLLIACSLSALICIIIFAVRLFLRRENSPADNISSLKGVGSAPLPEQVEAIPCRFNGTVSEIETDIDLSTPIAVPMMPQNEGSRNLCGNVFPSTVSSYSSSPVILQTRSVCGPSTSALATTSLNSGETTESPDIIGMTLNEDINCSIVNNKSSEIDSIVTPGIIASRDSVVASSCSNIIRVPSSTESQLYHYTTRPTFHATHIMSSDGKMQRSVNSGAGTAVFPVGFANITYNPPAAVLLPSISTLRRTKLLSSPGSPHPVPQQSSYDGTAPRILSTGLPENTQFYYG